MNSVQAGSVRNKLRVAALEAVLSNTKVGDVRAAAPAPPGTAAAVGARRGPGQPGAAQGAAARQPTHGAGVVHSSQHQHQGSAAAFSGASSTDAAAAAAARAATAGTPQLPSQAAAPSQSAGPSAITMLRVGPGVVMPGAHGGLQLQLAQGQPAPPAATGSFGPVLNLAAPVPAGAGAGAMGTGAQTSFVLNLAVDLGKGDLTGPDEGTAEPSAQQTTATLLTHPRAATAVATANAAAAHTAAAAAGTSGGSTILTSGASDNTVADATAKPPSTVPGGTVPPAPLEAATAAGVGQGRSAPVSAAATAAAGPGGSQLQRALPAVPASSATAAPTTAPTAAPTPAPTSQQPAAAAGAGGAACSGARSDAAAADTQQDVRQLPGGVTAMQLIRELALADIQPLQPGSDQGRGRVGAAVQVEAGPGQLALPVTTSAHASVLRLDHAPLRLNNNATHTVTGEGAAAEIGGNGTDSAATADAAARTAPAAAAAVATGGAGRATTDRIDAPKAVAVAGPAARPAPVIRQQQGVPPVPAAVPTRVPAAATVIGEGQGAQAAAVAAGLGDQPRRALPAAPSLAAAAAPIDQQPAAAASGEPAASASAAAQNGALALGPSSVGEYSHTLHIGQPWVHSHVSRARSHPRS